MFNILNTLNKSNKSNKSDNAIAAKIISRPTRTLCELQDNKGRQFIAESDGTYIAGETILVKDGVVIGKTKRLRNIKSFSV